MQLLLFYLYWQWEAAGFNTQTVKIRLMAVSLRVVSTSDWASIKGLFSVTYLAGDRKQKPEESRSWPDWLLHSVTSRDNICALPFNRRLPPAPFEKISHSVRSVKRGASAQKVNVALEPPSRPTGCDRKPAAAAQNRGALLRRLFLFQRKQH